MAKQNLFYSLLLLVLSIPIHAQVQKGTCKYFKQKTTQNGNIEKSILAENSRSDTIDIKKYLISLDITDFANQQIKGFCRIDFRSKLDNIDQLDLDLLNLNIDSVVQMNQILNFDYSNELLKITLSDILNQNDSTSVYIYYHGTPTVDASGFGGFDFAGNIAYNLGVAFVDIPHNYGRSWFPCFDNFVERSTYEFIIKTANGRKAFCNGELISETSLGGDTLVRHWVLEEEIPTYLACVAVSNYAVAEDSYSSVGGFEVPVTLVAHANDTTAMKNSFANLETCFLDFESKFGAYSWNKVGYVLTPVGAMEHPTLIAYPDFLANGNLGGEDIMAHELAHMWFGNLITCERAEEMWINEGLAEYLAYLFEETHYGTDVYKEIVRNNHLDVLWKAHHLDGGFYALNEVPQSTTYGEHSYNKGADVMHSLRGYLGDSLFFAAWQYVLENNKFKTLSSQAVESALNEVPNVNVSDFFNDWIYQPGFATFVIDSLNVLPNGNLYDVNLFIQQKLREANSYFQNVPLDITYRDDSGNILHGEILVSNQYTIVISELPFAPTMASINESERIGLATTGENGVYYETGISNLSNAFFRLEIEEITDTAFIRVEHNWVAPDAEILTPVNSTISHERYWDVLGFLPDNFQASGRIVFDGRAIANGNLDNELLAEIGIENLNEDSIALLYRPDASYAWTEYPFYEINTLGNNENKYGRIDFENLQLGQYTLGIKNMTVSINELEYPDFAIFPNPADDIIHITSNLAEVCLLKIFSIAGKLVYTGELSEYFAISTEGFENGIYVLRLSNNKVIHSEIFAISH